jgi:hypothetical protein
VADNEASAAPVTIEDQRQALRTEQLEAQGKAEASAARLALLDGLASGETAWLAAKDQFLADIEALWRQVRDCPATLKKALGEGSAQLKESRDDYGRLVRELEDAVTAGRQTAADAQHALEASEQALQAAQDAFTARFGNMATAMSARLTALMDLVTRLKAAMGGTPCDAATAYLLALDIADEYHALVAAAKADLAQEAAKALTEIQQSQGDVVQKAAAKQVADDAVSVAQAALGTATQDRYATIIATAGEALIPEAPTPDGLTAAPSEAAPPLPAAPSGEAETSPQTPGDDESG